MSEKSKSKKDQTSGKATKSEIKQKEGKEKKRRKQLSLKTKLYIVGGLVIILIAAGFVGLYVYSPIGKLTRPIFRNIPYPVAIVDSAVITSSELIQNAEAVRNFYESQDYSSLGMRVDFSTDEGKKRLKIKEKDILDKLIEDKIIENLANERGIDVTTLDAQRSIDQEVEKTGNRKALELKLGSLYGWSIEEFRDKVVAEQMYSDKLFEWYAENIEQQEGYAKIKQVSEALHGDGSNFSDIAKEFSEGESAQSGGEVGWFSYGQVVEEVADVAFKMEQGEISGVIASPLGFHIIQVEEIKSADNQSDENSQEVKEIKLRQIFVRGASFLEWLGEEKKKAQVYVLMKDYRWDSEQGRVRFFDQNLESMEKKLRMQSEGDPSL